MKNLIGIGGIFLLILIFTIKVVAQNTSVNEETVIDIVLGGMSPAYFGAMLLFALLGAITNIVSDSVKRKKGSKHSPEKFSLKYWWDDNWRRVISTIILVPVAIVACSDIFGVEIVKMTAFGIGFGSDHLIEIAKRKKLKLFKGVDMSSKPDEEIG